MRMLTIAVLMTGPVVGLTGCGDDNATAPDSETVLESVSPAAQATGVDPSTPVVMRFSGPMASGMEQYVDIHQGGIDGPVVPMTCTFSADRATLTCAHDEPLRTRTHYTIHMGSGMMDGSGHRAEIESHGMAMGGQPVTGQMMGGMHNGQPTGMMGQDWHDGDDHLGMAFTFETS
jgi:Bacterial Ig-like domain